MRLLAPLTAFRSEVERIELDQRTTIVKLRDEDLTELYDRLGPRQAFGFPPMTAMDLLSWTHAIEQRSEYEIATTVAGVVLDEHSQRAIPEGLTALRLLRESGVATAFIWTKPLRRSFQIGFGGTPVQYPLSRPVFAAGAPLVIDDDDAPAIQQLFASLRSIEHQNTDAQRRFELALGRLNSSSERVTIEDRMIDYWVALETLFAHDSRGEISYRARTRVSKYISDDVGERKLIARTLAQSYRRRSEIVHGDKPKPDLGQLTSETGEILRRALRRMLETGEAIEVELLDLA